MADESDIRDTLRAAFAEREERARAWEAREFPAAAYEAVEILRERLEPPSRMAEHWPQQIAGTVMEVSEMNDTRDAQAIAAAAEPDLLATAATLNQPSPFEQLQKTRNAIAMLGRPLAQRYRPFLSADTLRDVAGAREDDDEDEDDSGDEGGLRPIEPGKTVFHEMLRADRERAADDARRQQEMVSALTSLVDLSVEQARAADVREAAQEARERRMERYAVAGTVLTVLSVIAAVVAIVAQ